MGSATGSGLIILKEENVKKASGELQTTMFLNDRDTMQSVKSYVEEFETLHTSEELEEEGSSLFEEVLDLLGFRYEWSGDSLLLTEYFSESYRLNDIYVLGAFAKYIEPGGQLDMYDDFANPWRFRFDPTAEHGCLYEDGKMVFPSDGVGHVMNDDDGNAYWVNDTI